LFCFCRVHEQEEELKKDITRKKQSKDTFLGSFLVKVASFFSAISSRILTTFVYQIARFNCCLLIAKDYCQTQLSSQIACGLVRSAKADNEISFF
jgi:Glu-tRNA(Gln) amidotransferase subunit E-like FAD-binding protein